MNPTEIPTLEDYYVATHDDARRVRLTVKGAAMLRAKQAADRQAAVNKLLAALTDFESRIGNAIQHNKSVSPTTVADSWRSHLRPALILARKHF